MDRKFLRPIEESEFYCYSLDFLLDEFQIPSKNVLPYLSRERGDYEVYRGVIWLSANGFFRAVALIREEMCYIYQNEITGLVKRIDEQR